MVSRKTCSACGKRLSAAAFNDSARTADGLARVCRACTNSRRRELAKSGPQRPQRHSPYTLLATALRQGDVDVLRKLIDAGLIPDWSWICETLREGHLALAEFLLESKVERNVFVMAALADVKGLSRRLARAPDDATRTTIMEPASSDVTPMHVACASDWSMHGDTRMQDQVQVVTRLKECRADVNREARYRGIDNATPLFCACWSSRNVALVRWLLEQGATATDADFMAALGHLQRHGRESCDIAEELLAWGVPVDGTVRGDRTPLQAAAHQAQHRTVGWLLEHGADVNARGPGARTAAHLAAERNTGPRTLALLVEHGADLSAQDEDGRTPLQIARLNGKSRLVEWIKTHTRVKR